MGKRELVTARTLKSRISCTRHHSSRFVCPRSLPHITRDHRVRLISSKRELFAGYRYISYLFWKFLVCIHAGNPRMPPRVLASGPKPCGGIKGSCSTARATRMDYPVYFNLNPNNWSSSGPMPNLPGRPICPVVHCRMY